MSPTPKLMVIQDRAGKGILGRRERAATPADVLAWLQANGGEELPAFPMSDTQFPDAQYDAVVVNAPGRYLV